MWIGGASLSMVVSSVSMLDTDSSRAVRHFSYQDKRVIIDPQDILTVLTVLTMVIEVQFGLKSYW
jgi:hypothetical protein